MIPKSVAKNIFTGFVCIKGRYMNLNINPTINFRASVSEQLKVRLHRQAKLVKDRPNQKRTLEQLEEQLNNVKCWGDNDMEIVLTKNERGAYCLGLKRFVSPLLQITKSFRHLNGKTEISQFLGLKQKHFIQAEGEIQAQIKRYHSK